MINTDLVSSFSDSTNPNFLNKSLVLYDRQIAPKALLFSFAYSTNSTETLTVQVDLQDSELTTAKLISKLCYQILWRYSDRVKGSNELLPAALQESYKKPQQLTDLLPPYSGHKKLSDFDNKSYFIIYETLPSDHPISEIATQTCEFCLHFLAKSLKNPPETPEVKTEESENSTKEARPSKEAAISSYSFKQIATVIGCGILGAATCSLIAIYILGVSAAATLPFAVATGVCVSYYAHLATTRKPPAYSY